MSGFGNRDSGEKPILLGYVVDSSSLFVHALVLWARALVLLGADLDDILSEM